MKTKTKQNKPKPQKTLRKFCISCFFVCCCFCGIVFCFNNLIKPTTFANNTTINTVDVSGLDIENATKKLEQHLQSTLEHTEIEVVANLQKNIKNNTISNTNTNINSHFSIDNNNNQAVLDKQHNNTTLALNTINKNNISISQNLQSLVADIFDCHKNTYIMRFFENSEQTYTLPCDQVFVGINSYIQNWENKINTQATDASIAFDASLDNPIVYTNAKQGIKIDTQKLKNKLDLALCSAQKTQLDLPLKSVNPFVENSDIENKISLLSHFETSFKTSTTSRKHNIYLSSSFFNNMVILPQQEISFNQTTKQKNTDNGYEIGKIILDGKFVDGIGGGVCQTSTTLYNAVLLAGLQIVEVHSHSIPISYVPLGFDAMVSENLADFVFKNNTNSPIYIKVKYGDDSVCFEVYGEKSDVVYKRVNSLEKVIAHNGDSILPDSKMEYTNKITFKGEYLRVKYPSVGYVVKSYLEKYQGGELLGKVLVREVYHAPQNGIIMEGVEEVYSGIKIPYNKVKFIHSIDEDEINFDAVLNKLKKENKIIE